jgi:FtsP/CotA-like multicopper oxidase with cupredoxin domain
VRGTSADGSHIRCDHLTAGDGMSTMADSLDTEGKRLYIFGFNRVALPGETVPGLSDDGSMLPAMVTAPTLDTGDYPAFVMTQGTLAANTPAPTISVDEDDEYYLTLTNTGMIMRPDLFDPHTVHWHGFPNASSVFDGVPDASISINMGASLTYYYQAKDAGTYMYHCHVEATEHMQMGMLGNLFVRPRQNRCDLIADDPGVPGSVCPSIAGGGEIDHVNGDTKYAYNDGDGSTRYDVEVPIQLGSFDPDFHDASFNTQPLPFAAMRDRYFLLNGRGYPDTVDPNPMTTVDPLGRVQASQPVSSLITAAPGQRILLRISNLNVTDVYTVGVNGLPMKVVALDARLLRDDDGNDMYYDTNSITIGGGQSADVIIDTTGLSDGDRYFFYIKNLDKLANNAENFGGMLTEIQIAAAP